MMRGRTMIMVMSLAMTTNPNMTHTSTRMSTGAYVRPRVSGFSRDVGVDANTRRMEAAAAAVVAVCCASGAQVWIDNINDNRQEVAAAAAATTVLSPQSPSAPKSSGGMNFPSQSAGDTTPLPFPLLHRPPPTPQWHRPRCRGRERCAD
jgi:hypothetical protein